MDWKDHCPIDEKEWPVQRQAWRAGWEYRMQNSGHTIKDEVARRIARRMIDNYKPSLLSIWIQGYSAADSAKRSD